MLKLVGTYAYQIINQNIITEDFDAYLTSNQKLQVPRY